MNIHFNDAWDDIPLEFIDDLLEYFDAKLQPCHPLLAEKMVPVAKQHRHRKYLIEGGDDPSLVWILDLDKRRRVKRKTCYYFKKIKSQEELDTIQQNGYDEWVQYMKDAGAWGD